MTRIRTAGPLAAGCAASFLAAVNVARAIRPDLLLDTETTWAAVRFLLWLALISSAAGAGGVVAAILALWIRTAAATAAPRPLPLSRGILAVIAAAAFLLGAAARLVWLDRVPEPIFQDEVVLVQPSLELSGTWRDFADSIRPIPYGVEKPHGMIGVLYLEAYRLALLVFGTSVAGVRSLSFIAGILSMGTAFLLARELLPAGGGTLALLALAGMRWHMLLSRWGWHAVVLTPIIDLATLLLLRWRRRGGAGLALCAGLLVGIAAHVYLAAWVAAAALVGLALWPSEKNLPLVRRLPAAALVLAGLLLAASPLFLFRQGRRTPYFVRTGAHNILLEMRYSRTVFPLVTAAADALAAAWFTGDPEPRHDLPGRSRLGWILGVPAAVALARALRFPHANFSAFLLAHSGAALLASVASGGAGHPNSIRFGYLSTIAAVVSAGGAVVLLSAAAPRYRRALAIAAIGVLAIGGTLAAREVLLDWSARQDTYRSFHGDDTMLARSAVRWDRYGTVTFAPGLGVEPTTIAAVRRFRLDLDDRRALDDPTRDPGQAWRRFRIAAPSTPPEVGERVVERLADPWGRPLAIVLGQSTR